LQGVLVAFSVGHFMGGVSNNQVAIGETGVAVPLQIYYHYAKTNVSEFLYVQMCHFRLSFGAGMQGTEVLL